MTSIDDIQKVNLLLDIYGSLLTTDQKEILTSYYQFNLSFSEIAQERKISRSAVNDSIKKSVGKLENYDKKLGFVEKMKKIEEELDKNITDKEKINNLKEIIKNGI